MHGGRNKKDDLPKINNTNIFAALETLKKKKKSEKDHGKSKGSSKDLVKEPEPPVFWAPAPLTKKWADVEDEDEDDYFATTAPPTNVWGSSEPPQMKKSAIAVEEEESESEDEIDEIDDDVEDETEVPVPAEPVVKKPAAPSIVPKDAERQLSKKELKKKELAELDAVLAELGISNKDNNTGIDGTDGVADIKTGGQHAESRKNDSSAPATSESKTSKKKKTKKEKSGKEVKDTEEQPNGTEANTADETSCAEPPTEGDASGVVKEKIKKVTSMKKKKTNKEMDAAAKAAQLEAAARSARLAAAKKKEKNHYNQQPVR